MTEQLPATDFFNNVLNVGDTVAFMEVGYRSLQKGVIKSVTAKTVLVEWMKWDRKQETRQYHDQVIKCIKE